MGEAPEAARRRQEALRRRPRSRTRSSLRPPRLCARRRDRPFATIGYEADLTDEGDAWLRLRYQADGEPLDYKIRLVTTIPNYGGRRWWFICPLSRDDGGPPRRVAKLYLPPGERYFGRREAYELTYTSCQESGKYDRLFASIREQFGRR